jgi:transglutaminase-like putative cysteine protease
MKLRLLFPLCLVLCAATPVIAADEAPAWLREAAATVVPAYDKDVPGVVLRNEEIVTVASDGSIISTTTFAVRVLTREGRAFAQANEGYLTKSSRIRDLHAWLIYPNGKVKKFGKDETLDQISDENDIYNEYRVKRIVAADEADAGAIFGYESSREERPLFTQDLWHFQGRLPTLVSRYVLTLPAGWRASGIIFNRAKLDPSVTGLSYTWELTNLPPIRIEPNSPAIRNLAPLLAVTYFLADSTIGPGAHAFENWSQVSRWVTELNDPQATVDDAIMAKARSLTEGAKDDLGRIRAIAHFVQGLQYISIDIGVGRGNGYRPHSATDVLRKAYGDCKDKANLMRTLLKAVNITAFPVAIYSGDPTYVREEWASPGQFNHCIVAIKVGDEIDLPTVIKHDRLGRLLIFDATDESTPVGDLPEEEQGSFALLVAGDQGMLMRMPVMPPETSRLERQADVTLTADGGIIASLKERSTGQTAVSERRAMHGLSASEYRQLIERWISRGATSAKVSKVEPTDEKTENRFALDVEFSAAMYGQVMQDRLIVFKPAIVSRRESLFLTEATRKYPIVLDSRAFSETVRVKLPAGFEVDELPDALKLQTSFGTYATSYEVKNNKLVFSRVLTLRAGTIPSEQYAAVRSFFEKIRAAEQSPVVLARK